jgi:glyoxylate/hydroxypyruvate reductase A
VLTPHVASLTIARTASEFVIDNIRRHQAGQPLLHVVDPDQGY